MSPVKLRRPLLFFTSIVAGVALFGYGLFEARRLLAGPLLTIETPLDGSATSSAAVTLTGSAKNISFLTINDLPAYIDETGHFSQTLTPSPGYAIFTVAARDRFGRHTSKHVHITILNFCPIEDTSAA